MFGKKNYNIIKGLNLTSTLHCKYGFDRASSQKIYKQKFTQTPLEEAIKNEETLFLTGLVPLTLSINGSIIWRNNTPSSYRYCSPIKLEYIKENPEIIRAEYERLNNQLVEISTSENNVFNFNETNINLNYVLEPTMLDGKAINALTNTNSTQCCNICGVKPSKINNLNTINENIINEDAFKFG